MSARWGFLRTSIEHELPNYGRVAGFHSGIPAQKARCSPQVWGLAKWHGPPDVHGVFPKKTQSRKQLCREFKVIVSE
ncbi:hypothetical protein CYPRO_0368 [Cyclonatronum proteinivorum]|uniref:Uncharacterized protein n=1 Tax=Cyclonatronum proteinivorum TaxID=1457365 RepID=A0A345UGQ4_9BACT|nr:hypothetical protein CYPRO_0368 [Cyclonatronum proteinivorum]